jgi:hypothetical protein
MMSPLPSQPAESHWMETIAPGTPAVQADAAPLAVEATSHSEAAAEQVTEAVAQQHVEEVAHHEEPAHVAAAETEIPAPHAATDWSEQLAAAPAIDLGGKFDTEPRNFADSAPQFGSSSYHFASNETPTEQFATTAHEEPVAESATEWKVTPPDPSKNEVETEQTSSEPAFANESASESVTENLDAAPSEYAAQQEESLPLEQTEAQAEPAFAETLESQEGLLEPTRESLFESSTSVNGEEDFSERIPTLPPTNREALSDIAFLMPPTGAVEIHSESNETSNGTSNGASNGSSHINGDSTNVDDVVRKVLEKLQPQLQEMLAQGMKPLLENLVQNELQKKDR